jgi:hypothetical protein
VHDRKTDISQLMKYLLPTLAFGALLIGFVWMITEEHGFGAILFIAGWLSTLLIIGYYSTPAKSRAAKSHLDLL